MGIRLHSPIVLYFLVVFTVAYYGMWTVGDQNGVFRKAAGVCKVGGSRTEYSGYAGVDKVLCILVTFMESAFAVPLASPFRTIFLTVFSVPITILYLEAHRSTNPIIIQYFPLLVLMGAQLKGAGLAFPLFFAFYTLAGATVGPTTVPASRDTTRAVAKIQAIFPTVVLGYFATAIGMTDPLHNLQANTRQGINAMFQIFPLNIFVLRPPVATLLGSLVPTTAAKAKKQTLNALAILTTVMYWKAAFDFHSIATANSLSYASLAREIILPSTGLHPSSPSDGAHIFLLFDAAATFAATFGFVAFAPGVQSGDPALIVKMLGMMPIVGPATAMVWGWRARGLKADADFKGKKKA